MSKINPDTLKDLFLAAMTDVPQFEYIIGDQPFMIKYKGQRYHVYMIKLTSAYFKTRPDTTRAQLNRRTCFEEIKQSSDPFIFLGYDVDNDVLVCWNNKVAKARLNEKSTVSFYSRKIYQDQIVLGEPRHFKLKNGDQPYFFKRKDLPIFLEKVETLFPEITSEESPSSTPVDEKNDSKIAKELECYLQDAELLSQLRPMLIGPAKRTLEAIQAIVKFYRNKYNIHITIRESSNLLKKLHLAPECDATNHDAGVPTVGQE